MNVWTTTMINFKFAHCVLFRSRDGKCIFDWRRCFGDIWQRVRARPDNGLVSGHSDNNRLNTKDTDQPLAIRKPAHYGLSLTEK